MYSRAVVVATLGAALLLAVAAPLWSQAQPRAVNVSVVDQAGAAVPDLGPSDFIVREDNLSREVLRVALADDPMQIAILVDNSTAARNDVINIRRGLPAFVDVLLQPTQNGRHNQVAIIGLADRPTILADFTSDRTQLGKAIDRIWGMPMSGNYLLDATTEVLKGFKRREAARPVIIAITTDGPELSFARYPAVLSALADSGAAFHVLSIGPPSVENDDASIARNIVIDQGPEKTGGLHERILTSITVDMKLLQLANVLTHEYRVTYAHPDSLIPPDKVTVSVKRPNLSAHGRPARVDSTEGSKARP